MYASRAPVARAASRSAPGTGPSSSGVIGTWRAPVEGHEVEQVGVRDVVHHDALAAPDEQGHHQREGLLRAAVTSTSSTLVGRPRLVKRAAIASRSSRSPRTS